MINLLPDELKAEIHAARTNVILVKYMVILMLGAIFLCTISVAVYFVLIGTRANAETVSAENASKTTAYSPVQAQATTLRASLQTAKTILDKEIVYTKVITNIAKAVPSGVVLESLTLEPTTFGTPVTLSASAKSIDDGLALVSSFQKSSLFSGVSLISISSGTGVSTGYPYVVSLSVTINKGVTQ